MSKSFARIPEAHSNGGFIVQDQKAIEEQRAVVWDLVKKLGQNITQGQPLTKIAIPVHIAEPRSYLERIADGWCYAPAYLVKAAQCNDALERFKNVITFAVSGLINTVTQKKPFNPIWGETYEGEYEDGTKLYCEQVSHHPPISSFEMIGPDECYHFYGSGEWVASFRGNSVKGHQLGNHYIDFKDGTQIIYTLPECWAKGVMWGERICDYEGLMEFKDAKNNFYACLKFNPEAGGWFSWGKKLPSDYFRGGIYEGTAKDDNNQIAELSGSWLGTIEFDGLAYWTFDQDLKKSLPIKKEQCLPSDCRFREDVNFLAKGDMEKAAEWKAKLEELQRRDRKLREAVSGNGKEEKKEKKEKKKK